MIHPPPAFEWLIEPDSGGGEEAFARIRKTVVLLFSGYEAQRTRCLSHLPMDGNAGWSPGGGNRPNSYVTKKSRL